nr:hypothetical protein [Tanacetum cinerariifolium]
MRLLSVTDLKIYGCHIADDVADVVANADAEPTPLSPTPATTPPTQQELIPSSSQLESYNTPKNACRSGILYGGVTS